MKLLPYQGVVNPSGSKSILQRFLFIASLTPVKTILRPGSICEDVLEMAEALKVTGGKVNISDDEICIDSQRISLSKATEVKFNASATALRFWLARAIVSTGKSTIMISDQLFRRPLQPFLDTLQEMGCEVVVSDSGDKDFPHKLEIDKVSENKHNISLDNSVSSQFISGLMMISPLMEKSMRLFFRDKPVSYSYLILTVQIMKNCGVKSDLNERDYYFKSGSSYQMRSGYKIEPELAGGALFLSLGAFSRFGIGIRTPGITKLHPDWQILKILNMMGTGRLASDNTYVIKAGKLHGFTFGFEDYPDLVPLAAVMALFADGISRLAEIDRIRFKESDRIQGILMMLELLNAEHYYEYGNLTIYPLATEPGEITLDTQGDHRLVMAFTLLQLHYPQIKLTETESVSKSCPEFFLQLEGLKIQE